MSHSKLVLLDADDIIHFSKGDKLGLIPQIVEPHQLCILETVYEEIHNPQLRKEIDNLVRFQLISDAEINDNDDIYLEAIKLMGKPEMDSGEAACLAYARFTDKIIASSNLSDITKYCGQHDITYLTTLDLLAIAKKRNLLSSKECNNFINIVRKKNSNIPLVEINHYCQQNGVKMYIFD